MVKAQDTFALDQPVSSSLSMHPDLDMNGDVIVNEKFSKISKLSSEQISKFFK
jgi:hypothetical protein